MIHECFRICSQLDLILSLIVSDCMALNVSAMVSGDKKKKQELFLFPLGAP